MLRRGVPPAHKVLLASTDVASLQETFSGEGVGFGGNGRGEKNFDPMIVVVLLEVLKPGDIDHRV